jgi:hypothetical protein
MSDVKYGPASGWDGGCSCCGYNPCKCIYVGYNKCNYEINIKDCKFEICPAPKTQNGEIRLGRHHFESHLCDWNLDKGCGERYYRVRVKFDRCFSCEPHIHLGTVSQDCHNGVRYRVWAENVDRSGFDLVVYTWADSIVYGIGVSWMAFI